MWRGLRAADDVDLVANAAGGFLVLHHLRANQYDPSHFGTFAVFADNGGRFAHLTGQIPRALGMTGLSLLGGAPEVHMVDVMTGTARQGD